MWLNIGCRFWSRIGNTGGAAPNDGGDTAEKLVRTKRENECAVKVRVGERKNEEKKKGRGDSVVKKSRGDGGATNVRRVDVVDIPFGRPSIDGEKRSGIPTRVCEMRRIS